MNQRQQHHPNTDADFLMLKSVIRTHHNLVVSTGTEILYMQSNLDSILEFVRKRTASYPSDYTLKTNKVNVANMKLVFATIKSESETIVSALLQSTTFEVGLLGSEAKGEDQSLLVALNQAIHCSCELLYNMVHKLDANVEKVAVPFLLVAGGHLQIGVVYSLAHKFYPVPLLLTGPISLHHQMNDAYHYLEALASYLGEYLLAQSYRVVPGSGTEQAPLRLTNNHDAPCYFFKPLQLFFKTSLGAVARFQDLLYIFDCLFESEELQDIVVFPVGFIGYPAEASTFAANIRAYLDDIIDPMLIDRVKLVGMDQPIYRSFAKSSSVEVGTSSKNAKRKRTSGSDTANANVGETERSDQLVGSDSAPVREDSLRRKRLPDGYPIVVYPFLDSNVWTQAGELYRDSHRWVIRVPENNRQKFYDEVEEAVRHMTNVGVCHLDLRLSNIFFCITEDDHVKIKIIDFDFSQPINCPLYPAFQYYIANTINEFPKQMKQVTTEWNTFMLTLLKTALGLEIQEVL